MSRNKNTSRKKSASVDVSESMKEVEQHKTRSDFSAAVDSFIKALVTALLFSRFFVAAENADEGGTLGLVFLWLIAVIAWMGNRLAQRECRLQLSWIDIAAYVVVIGHVISALMIVFTSGQKQHASNLMIEWIGVGFTLFLLRQTIQTSIDKSRLLIAISVFFSVIAGLGLYQHYVFYPAARAEYQKLAESAGQAGREDQLEAAQEQLREMGVPEDEPAKTLFLQRLMNSSEPFGFFALANTLAGILAVGFVLLLGMTVGEWKRFTLQNRCALVVMLALVGYCLLLTKSRTAQVGAVIGCVILGIHWIKTTSQMSIRKLVPIAGISLAILASAVGLASLTGGIDFQVLSEAPKSFLYRMEYWRGTLAVISEHPILGVGPGNFRQAYLQQKLPESSEEIADPHNMFLDVWANGGFLALLGLVALLSFICMQWRTKSNIDETEVAEITPRWPVVPGVFISIFLMYFLPLVLGVSLDDRVLIVGLITAALIFSIFRVTSEIRFERSVSLAAFFALSIHLLGAGGIGMPAVLHILLLCAVLGTSPTCRSFQLHLPHNKPVISGFIAISLVTPFFLGSYAYRQHVSAMALVDAKYAKSEAAFLGAVSTAAENAPWSPEPWLLLAGHFQNQWRQNREISSRATQSLEKAIDRNPESASLHAQMGDWQMELYQKSEDQNSVQLGVKSYAKAAELYPTNARNLAKLAFALEESGDRNAAEVYARQSLRQNQTNRRLGHVDKVLDEKTVARLHAIDPGD